MNTVTLHYEVDGYNFDDAGEASSSVKRELRQMGLSNDIIRRTSICLYEGEINMVIHALGGDIDVTIGPERLVMVLRDKGPGIEDVELAMREGYSTASASVRSLGFGAGMGLANMKKYADTIRVESTMGVGTTVTMTIELPPKT